MVNVQVCIDGGSAWEDYGDCSIVEACRQYVSDACAESVGTLVVQGETWDVQARYEHQPDVIWKVRIQPRAVMEVLKSRGE